MAGRIPSEFIDQLLNQADIVDVVNSRVPLKKAGREYQACCPFHHEKTPSFTVSPAKQFYHCFGCGAHGSAISFIMEYDNLDFPDAVEELAKHMGLEVPREQGQYQGPDFRPLYDLLDHCRQFYSQQLRQHAQANHAVEYLKQRGLSGDVAARYQIGFAPPGWDNLLKQLGKDDKSIKRLVETGMVTQAEEGKQYDRFRERIMFPIRDRRGRVIGFGGRLLGDGKPKYLNSPETPVFHKGRELYGLYEARQANKTLSHLLVVEGYMDVVALAQFDISYAVATLGTATTNEHLQLIYKTTPEVVFCFDGDRAGRDAGWKALQTCLPHMRDGKQAKFMFLPNGEDPDTLVRKEGKQAFEQRILDAMPLSEFLFQKLSEQVDMRNMDGRVRLAELAKPFLQQLPEGLYRDMMNQRLNEIVGIEKQAIPGHRAGRKFNPARKSGLPSITPTRRAIYLLLHFPQQCAETLLPEIPLTVDTPGLPLLQELHQFTLANPQKPLGQILEHWRNTENFPALNKISQLNLDILEEDAGDQFEGTIKKIIEEQMEKELEQLLAVQSPDERTKQRIKELFAAKTAKSANSDKQT